MVDYEEILLARDGNEQIIEKIFALFKEILRAKARHFFIIGADSDDVYQEGMIGLLKAIKYYNPDKQVSFKTFASLCIQRQVITAIRTSFTKNSKDRVNAELDEIENNENIEEKIISKTDFENLDLFLKNNLSSFEQKVYFLLLQDYNYREIADKLDRSPKSIDNTIQRIKKKAHIWMNS